ncbi:hypothetical protein Hanom_Chr03g00197821 [Helianthus anomalus]
MCDLYTKLALWHTRLVFWVEFSCLICNIGIRDRFEVVGPQSGGLERAINIGIQARFGVVVWKEPSVTEDVGL